MQAQVSSRPAAASQPQPPTAPNIPVSTLQQLIPRLMSTINDIDTFRAAIAQGHQDGTLPSWDILLQRYGMLLGRISSLHAYIEARPPPPPAAANARPGMPTADSVGGGMPKTQGYFLHPLHPLPADTPPGSLAPETFFQVLSTHTNRPPAESDAPGGSSRRAELRAMDERRLGEIEADLRKRAEKSRQRARAVVEEIERRGDEVEWDMRIRPDEPEGEGEGDDDNEDEEKVDSQGAAESGLQSKEEGDVVVIDTASTERPPDTAKARTDWTLNDFVKLIDSGTLPQSRPSAS